TPAKIGLQLGHAGRKGSTQRLWEGPDRPLLTGGWPILAPSPIPYAEDSPVPREMTAEDMAKVSADFVRSAEMAEAAGFDLLELHFAPGSLLGPFLSPLTNRRRDRFGGDVAARAAFPLEIFERVRAVWPAKKPMSVRISASDWAEGGISLQDVLFVA